MNKKGFTLIELLAVIVILGVILVIAVPSISSAILNSRKKSYVATANEFVDGVRMATLNDASLLPTTDNPTYFSLDEIKLEKGSNTKSTFGKTYSSSSYIKISYDALKNEYVYAVCIVDESGNGIGENNGSPINITALEVTNVQVGTATCTENGSGGNNNNDDTIVEGTSSDWEVSTTTNDSGGYTLLKFVGDIENSANVTVSTNYYTDANISQMYFMLKGIASTSEMSNTNAYTINIPNIIDGKNITELGPALFSGVDFVNSDLENGYLVYFDSNLRIKEVNIPEGIKVIYDTTNEGVSGSFVYDINLSKITLPSTLTHIGNYSFAATNLTKINIPKSVITIGNYAFGHFANFESITFEGASDGTSHLTTIGDAAFNGLSETIDGTSYSVTLPSTTTTIGDYAFENNNISILTFAETSHLTSIGNGAFRDNDITALTIPASVISIGDYAFENNPLTSLTFAGTSTSGSGIDTASLTTIGYSTFDVDNVNSIIYLPSTLTSIDGYSFSCDYRDSTCTIYVNNTAIPDNFRLEWAGNYARKYVLNGLGSYTCVENCP